MPTKKTAKKTATKKTKGKTTKKKAVKKSTTKKKSGTRSSGKRALVCVSGQECFWTTDGTILSNLVELEASLRAMTDEVFKHHVTKEKNDFADWIEHSLQDSELATALRRAKKPTSARTIVVRRLKVYDI